ncbi:phospholipid metabolism enzyme regulator [Ophiostoma piceae UAMH 11346]|uniref:Phospholipid metabolism enzyme regulator n=1 Tax=Ophiostoma piceae (strain UAMH 11346) TaxID=1262450 RepID=S3C7G4_OPHP1|nr:phospholipid metabolism enzyme regulator [Ophiostoma piceae UAMH 11346]
MDKSSNAVNGAPANQAYSPHPTLIRESSSSSMRRLEPAQSTRQQAQAQLQASQPPSAATSASASPFASRESSPARPSARSHTAMKVATAAAAAASSGTPSSSASSQRTRSPSLTRQQLQQQRQPSTNTPASSSPSIRSRRNSSQQETSPARSRTAIPTPGAQKPAALTLSSTTTPALPPVIPDAATSRTPGPQKSDPQPQNSPRWPISPRLRSPPRFPDTPALHLPRPALASTSPEATAAPSDSEAEDLYLQSGMRTPVRGASGNVPTLETVQEASPLGPSYAVDAALEKLETASVVSVSDAGISTTPEVAEVSSVKTIRARQLASQNAISTQSNESGSENGSTKNSNNSNNRRTAASGSTAPPLTSRNSMAKITTVGKGKTGEGSQPTTMTVETETVTSIPNVALGPSAAQGVNGSLRTKPSSETIRPKKEKKKTTRKQTPVTPGATTSKADIFEAKVASAVDEANTSDSEETFVYDSNPADGRDRPHRFHHSRTPSATSLSQADRSGMRSIHSIMEGGGPSGGVTVKKSMKFVNTFGNTSSNDSGMGDDETNKAATIRGVTGSGRGTARLHHHVGRFGLGGGAKNGHQSILDHESPFPVSTASRLKMLSGGSGGGVSSGGPTSYPSGRTGGPTSPRASGGSMSGRSGGTYSQKRGYGSTGGHHFGYDMDDTTPGQAGSDERTPLMGTASLRGTVRGNNRTSRRHHMSLRALEQQSYHHHPPASFLNRFASCLVLTVMLMLVISGAIGFMFATSQPLDDIELVKISNVIASEQELMFDLMVRAHNPNVVVVTVDSADMEVFAKSPHAGTDSEWWRRPNSTDMASAAASAADKAPRDQPDSSPNFLLGKFTSFDNPLSFEGSFFHHGLSTSRSGVRIRRPGNGTDGGSERWERILDDEFDLIIKGVLRYSLPLSQRVRSALIEGRRTVKPNAADDPVHNGTVTISGGK